MVNLIVSIFNYKYSSHDMVNMFCRFTFSIFIFNGKIYSLCQNNSISKKVLSKFSFKYFIGLLFS